MNEIDREQADRDVKAMVWAKLKTSEYVDKMILMMEMDDIERGGGGDPAPK